MEFLALIRMSHLGPFKSDKHHFSGSAEVKGGKCLSTKGGKIIFTSNMTPLVRSKGLVFLTGDSLKRETFENQSFCIFIGES